MDKFLTLYIVKNAEGAPPCHLLVRDEDDTSFDVAMCGERVGEPPDYQIREATLLLMDLCKDCVLQLGRTWGSQK